MFTSLRLAGRTNKKSPLVQSSQALVYRLAVMCGAGLTLPRFNAFLGQAQAIQK
jgi:hypothetical protein